MHAHFQGVLNHYNIKWRLEIVVSCLVPLQSFELSWTRVEWQFHCAHFFLYCVRTVSVCRLRCDKSWWVCQGRHQQSLNRLIRFRVKIVFFSYGDFCVLYSGKSVLCIQAKVCFVFRQKWLIAGIRSAAWGNFKWDIRKRGVWGAKPPT